MEMPKDNDPITQEQVDQAVNLDRYSDAVAGKKGWHRGLFEPWTLKYGYPDGMAMYAEVKVGNDSIHIYFLNDMRQAPIILKAGETPADYGFPPLGQ